MRDKVMAFETRRQAWLFLVARLFLASYFIWSGATRLLHWDLVAEYFSRVVGANTELVLLSLSAFEILGGLAIVLGLQTRRVALGLMLYCLVSSLAFNRFWAFPEEEQFLQLVIFMKNVGIMGCLEVLRVCGAGSLVWRLRR